jgi:aspartyl-tRNA(Asn)/glutamyl-tRNA(Gln) amidotransferase subunit A
MPQPTRRDFLSAAAASAALYLGGRRAFAQLAEPQTSANPLTALSLAEASRLIHKRQLSSTQLTQALLDRIAIYNPILNAYITVMAESALAQAATLDREAAAGHFRGPLHGIPIAIKDNIDTSGTRTTAGSKLFDDRVPTEDAFVIAQLKQAGAVLLGKTNLHEFAMGGSSATTYFGPVRNPWALDRTPSGSSGGSAAAVIAELAPAALGTDTGGSIRMPAAYCSLVGLKPTYGLISLRGIFPLIYSLDHCGPLARTVEDAALLLTAMTGYDELDVASVEHPREDYAALMREPVAGLRLGIPRAPFFDHLEPEIANATEQAIAVLTTLVRETKTVQLPSTSHISWAAVRSGEVEAVHQELFRHNADAYSLQTRRVVGDTQSGLNDNSSEACSGKVADYVTAQWELVRLRKTVDDAFTGFDLVALPTMRVMPRTINEELSREEDPKPHEPEVDSNAIAFNLLGIPAISIPCGFSKDGLPIGLMIAGPRFSEGRILALAKAYESVTQWHTRRPQLTPGMAVPTLTRKS